MPGGRFQLAAVLPAGVRQLRLRDAPYQQRASVKSPVSPGRVQPGKQIRSHEIRRCAAVSNHQHFRRACGHIDRRTVQTLAHLTFCLGDKGVTRPGRFCPLSAQISVPNASAAMACAPPTLNTSCTPHSCAA